MAKHEIHRPSGYSFEHVIASSHGKGSAKRLVVRVVIDPLSAVYVMTDHDTETYRGDDLDAAVKAYNAAP